MPIEEQLPTRPGAESNDWASHPRSDFYAYAEGAAIGGRYDITEKISFGAAYQFPLTNGQGSNILDYRITTDFIFKFC